VDGGDQNGTGQITNIVKAGGYQRGDAAAGLAQADVIVERTFNTPMVHQSPVETQAVVVQPDPLTGGAQVWVSTQGPFGVRKDVAAAPDVPEADVRVRGMTIGGGFGSKNGLYEPLVALAARLVGRPVRLWLTRTEEMLAANPAPPVRIRGRLGAKRDGSLTGLECQVTVDGGCYPFDLGKFLAYMFGSLYRVPNFDLQGRDVLTFKVSAGAYRAPGAPSVTFAIDCLMDEMAAKLGLDPLEFRLRHAAQPGDRMAKDKDTWPSMGMTAVLEALQQHPAWQKRAEARARGHGVGMAVGGWLGGTEPAAAVCRLNRDGTLQVHVGSMDLNGTATGFALMAAETFGVAPEQVRVLISDTDTAPYSGASAGSKVTYATGSAVVQAAREARRQVLAVAAEELEAAVEDLEIVNGQVQVRGAPDRGLLLKDLADKTYDWGSRHAPVYGAGRFAVEDSAPAFNAQLAEVEVDADTGAVRVHKLVVVQDVGRAINPLAVQGQMRGGATQGIGWALYEQMLYDDGGQLVTGTLMEYTLPSISQTAPDIDTVLVEVPSEYGPFGARGVGEAPVVPTAAAVANAVADATGVRLTDLPLTAPRVWAVLRARPL
jgi:CO/xanthine dehydrogenase Mo-binding subunit